MIDILSLPQKEIVKGFKARFIHTESMTIAFWEAEAGASIPMHNHIHEQVMQVTEGQFEFTIDGQTNVYQNGSVVVIPSNVMHGGTALTNCKIVDIFNPVRQDYKNA
jgi:quercetin dioxygenase-like cupin family protein